MGVRKNIGIIGCGLLGMKRAAALGEHRLSICADVVPERANQLAAKHDCEAAGDWRQVATSPAVDVVLVSATPDQLAPITLACLESGKDVLVEKPAGLSAHQLKEVETRAQALGAVVRVGFNHRFHPALQKAKVLLEQGELGQIMFIRARYGHGGRPGYEKEWRADPRISGGGELIDQGFHLIDLSRWLLQSEFTEVSGSLHTFFWQMPVEDNAFLLLKTSKNQVAWLHTSWTEWKNLFSFEIFGRTGKIQIDGLGGSYGLEQLALYRMSEAMGPPETQIWQYPQADQSFAGEFQSFLADVAGKTKNNADLNDAIAAFEIAEAIYKKNSAAAAP